MFREVLSIRYVVISDQATRHYMPERMTLNWDLLISSGDAERAKADLQTAGAHTFRPLRIPGFSCRMPDGLLVDLLESEAETLAVVAVHLPEAVEDLRALADLGKRERPNGSS